MIKGLGTIGLIDEFEDAVIYRHTEGNDVSHNLHQALYAELVRRLVLQDVKNMNGEK